MLQKTTGLVLHTTPHGETSLIVKMFTRQLGVRSYMVKGVRSVKGRTKQNLMQPLSYLDMVVYDKPRDINFIKEILPACQWQSLDTNPVKTALRFFASETLYKSLRENEPSPTLFDFVVKSLCQLDENDTASASFPITFLLGLSHHIGIEPLDNYSRRLSRFNLAEGCFQEPSPIVPQLSSSTSQLLHTYLLYLRNATSLNTIPFAERQQLLTSLITYYEIHLSDFHNFKSHEVLHAVLR